MARTPLPTSIGSGADPQNCCRYVAAQSLLAVFYSKHIQSRHPAGQDYLNRPGR